MRRVRGVEASVFPVGAYPVTLAVFLREKGHVCDVRTGRLRALAEEGQTFAGRQGAQLIGAVVVLFLIVVRCGFHVHESLIGVVLVFLDLETGEFLGALRLLLGNGLKGGGFVVLRGVEQLLQHILCFGRIL
ncbi:hypothetical protein [Breoghania sp.]|uniref:hypothetical protein n=1 Tax=Breoghania sp. TaxID=2065378 RepID=UPI00263942F0|nr:hypothetical protein [Breoghania sp.]